jgi:hypothetical protein
MSQGPSNPLGNRPRMAEALASLKEGLRDTADPLYDSWKLRSRPATPPKNEGQTVEEEAPHAARFRGEALEPVTEATIDITVEGAADALPTAVSEESASSDELSVDTFPTEEGFSLDESLNEADDAAPTPRRSDADEQADDAAPTPRLSVQADTVRVRVIRYAPFPRWALIVAVALVIFAGSVVALRAGFLGDGARATRSVLASEMPATQAAPRPAVVRPPPPSATQLLLPANTPPPPTVPSSDATRAVEPWPPSTAPDTVPGLVQPPVPAGKMPNASPRRRSGAGEFFRDPGF